MKKRNKKVVAIVIGVLLMWGVLTVIVNNGNKSVKRDDDFTNEVASYPGDNSYDKSEGIATDRMYDDSMSEETYEGGSNTKDMGMVDESTSYSESEGMNGPMNSDNTTSDISLTSASNRKLIRTATLSLETREFDSLITSIQNSVKQAGGYIEMSDISGNSYTGTNLSYANYTIRVPEDKIEELINQVSEISNVTYKTENVTDVTLEYVDVESQKDALEIEQDRLLKLLEKADTLETIIALESRLTDVRYQLQSFESQLRTYDSQVEYATINLSISEVETLTIVESESTLDKMTSGFKSSLSDIKDGFVDFGIKSVITIPYLVMWLVAIIIAYCILRLAIIIIKKKNKRNKSKNSLVEKESEYTNNENSVTREKNVINENNIITENNIIAERNDKL